MREIDAGFIFMQKETGKQAGAEVEGGGRALGFVAAGA